MLENGNWKAIKTFKRAQEQKTKLQLRHENGSIINLCDQAEAMATLMDQCNGMFDRVVVSLIGRRFLQIPWVQMATKFSGTN